VSSPLAGKRIAVTRPQTGELGARLTELGATVVHVPLIEVGDPADGGVQLRAALARLAAFDWLVVTSANGASRAGPAAAGHPGLCLAAVGPATAAALAASAGRAVDLVPAVARAEGLLAEFPLQPTRVLLAQADRARRTLADGLVARGHTVESVVAYRTVPRRPSPDELTTLMSADAVLLASGSAAAALADALEGAPSPVLVAIGPVTASDAAARGLRVAHVATSPDASSVSDLLARVIP
jgi:uroporphyrinogen-III synthase